MKKSIEDIINAARTEPVEIPFETAAATAKQRFALLSLKSGRFRRIRTFLTGVAVGILLASISFGYFLSQRDTIAPSMPSVAAHTSGQQAPETIGRTQNPSQLTNTTVRYITRYVSQPLLPDFFRQPSWNEIAYAWVGAASTERGIALTAVGTESKQPQEMQHQARRNTDDGSDSENNTSASETTQHPSTTKNTAPTPLSSLSLQNSAIHLHRQDAATPQIITQPFNTDILEKRDFVPNAASSDVLSDFRERLSVGMRGITTLYAQRPVNESLTPDSYILENAVMYGSYSLSNNTAIGAEVGYDTYYQRFKTIDPGTNTEYDNEQYPNVWWLSAFIRQRIPFNEQFAAIAQGGLGGTLNGLIGRTIIGLTYTPDARTEIMIGLEGSSMMYSNAVSGTRFSSKIGLTYGVSVKF